MKEFVLLKEGAYTVDAFADVMETFNDFDHEELHYLTRTNVSVLLHANTSTNSDTHSLALSHFSIDPRDPPENTPSIYHPIDTNKLKAAANEYGTAIVIALPTGNMMADNTILETINIAVRDESNRLIDYDTKEPFTKPNEHLDSITFFGIIRLKGLPLYYLITDSSLVKIGDGFDFDDSAGTLFKQATDIDGHLRDCIFIPVVNDGNELINTNIFATSDIVEIDFFSHPHSLFASSGVTDQLGEVEFDVKSNFNFSITNNKIIVDISAQVGYISIIPKLGSFSERADVEDIKFEFSIFKI